MKIEGLEETYNTCKSDGLIRSIREIDKHKIGSLLQSSKEDHKSFNEIKEVIEKGQNYSFMFRMHYDILRKLIDAFLLFDKVKSSNHQCTNAYICTNYDHLDWDKIETIRIIRNKISYEGSTINKDIWKSQIVLLDLYTKSLIEKVQNRLQESG